MSAGVTDVVIAMPHRGPLNLLTEMLGYPAETMFHKVTCAFIWVYVYMCMCVCGCVGVMAISLGFRYRANWSTLKDYLPRGMCSPILVCLATWGGSF